MSASGAKIPRRSRPLGDGNLQRTCSTRDWADLGDGPAGLIAELVLASDVADYVRFRAVCQSWRRCSTAPRAGGLDARFLPRRWIMLDKAFAGPRRHRFLNVSTGECIRTDLPQLADHKLLALNPEGLLLLFHDPTLAIRLLNPLTHQLADLPPMTALLTPEQHPSRFRCPMVSGVGLVAVADTSEVSVAVSFLDPLLLVVAKPGDESWTVVSKKYMNSTLPFKGRFYCASTREGVMVLNVSSDDQQTPRLEMVADWSNKSFCFPHRTKSHSLHLVDNGGELMLAHRMPCRGDMYTRKYGVYRVDLEAGVLVPVKSFNGRALFMGMGRSISVSAEAAFPSPVAADTIYLGYDCDVYTRSYNVADESRCSSTSDVLVRRGEL